MPTSKWDPPEVEWDQWVHEFWPEKRVPLPQATDYTILEYLKEGKVGPLAYYMALGHSPSSDIWRFLWKMYRPDQWSAKDVPFELKLVNRSAGRPKKTDADRRRSFASFATKALEEAREDEPDAALRTVLASFFTPRPAPWATPKGMTAALEKNPLVFLTTSRRGKRGPVADTMFVRIRDFTVHRHFLGMRAAGHTYADAISGCANILGDDGTLSHEEMVRDILRRRGAFHDTGRP